MATLQKNRELTDDLGLLASSLDMLDLSSADEDPSALSVTRDRLTRSIRSYLIPRIEGRHEPLTVVFAGPTGSGKSTLVNTLSGLEVSVTGPVRPTTRGPVALTTEAHRASLSRIGDVDCEVMTGSAPILSSVALIDTPDLDSTAVENRATAEILIDNADIVVFVTSVLRYADLVPWEILRRAGSRGAPVINVLNRVTAGSAGALTDFRSMLEREGLGRAVVRVPEHHIASGSHRIPSLAVRQLQRRLLGLVSEVSETRREVVGRVMQSTTGQILELVADVERLARRNGKRRDEIRARMHNAARVLDLDDLSEIVAPPKSPSSRLGGFLWRWLNPVSEEHWSALGQAMAQELVTIVETDVRRLVTSSGDADQLTIELIGDLRSMVSGAASAWFAQLESLAGSSRTSARRLAALGLAEAALRRRNTPAFDVLFEDGSALPKAYRGLVSRLEVIYDEIGGRLAARSGATLADTDRVRDVTRSVLARSLFADA